MTILVLLRILLRSPLTGDEATGGIAIRPFLQVTGCSVSNFQNDSN
jgi:hypothetical protein